MSYSVTLIGWRHAGKADIHSAEQRFRSLLDAEFGSKLPAVYRAWLAACCSTHDLQRNAWPGDARLLIDRWDRAYEKARVIALEFLPGKGSEPWFDVQLQDGP